MNECTHLKHAKLNNYNFNHWETHWKACSCISCYTEKQVENKLTAQKVCCQKEEVGRTASAKNKDMPRGVQTSVSKRSRRDCSDSREGQERLETLYLHKDIVQCAGWGITAAQQRDCTQLSPALMGWRIWGGTMWFFPCKIWPSKAVALLKQTNVCVCAASLQGNHRVRIYSQELICNPGEYQCNENLDEMLVRWSLSHNPII